ncbi:MAG: hypothetical protein ACLQBL_28740 [Polyangiaceae bacterium]|jgi:hypothetical protein
MNLGRRLLFPGVFVAITATLVFVFHGGVSANPASRALTVLGLTELGTLSADPWAKLTIDHAIVDGHTYSDKAPLSSFVVLPFYALWHLVRGRPYLPRVDLKILVLLGDVVAAAIPFGAFVLLLEERAARWVRGREAVLVALMAAFGTPLFSYGASYFGHALAGAFFAFAYDAVTRDGSSALLPQLRPEQRALLAGFLAGLGVLTELPIAIGTALLGLYLLSRPPGAKLALSYAAGGLPCALALGAYNRAITGSPFDPPYRHLPVSFYTEHPFVLDAHALAVAGRLLFGQYRGLFFYAPALLFLVPLAMARIDATPRRVLFGAFCLVQLGFVAAFWMWDGGWCIGPRHLTSLMMILLYEGVDAVARTPRARPLFLGLAGVGVAINLVAVATNPFAPSERPFSDLYWPAFKTGSITPDNVFDMVGLNLGRWIVVVWCALFACAIVLLGRMAERRSSAPGP